MADFNVKVLEADLDFEHLPYWDVVIIGAGPAGLAAGLTTAHRALTTVIVEAKDRPGGQPQFLYSDKRIVDIPGFPDGITGDELSDRTYRQAVNALVQFRFNEELIAIEDTGEVESGDPLRRVVTSRNAYLCRKVIIACGLLHYPRRLGVLDKLDSRNVHYKMPKISDYEGQSVAVVGGGDSALDAALMALGRHGKVDVIIREAEPAGKPDTLARIRDAGGVIRVSTEIAAAEFSGERLRLTLTTGDAIECSTVIVQIGFLSAKDTFERLGVQLNEDGSIAIDPYFETSREGIFAVGDVHGDIKLITVAWAEGIQAAIHAFKEITSPYWLNEKRLRDNKISLIGEKITPRCAFTQKARVTRVVIVGAGFAGLNAAKVLGGAGSVEVTIIDRRNHHLFQPLLYQVAMAGLSPADIAAPIRSILSQHKNVRVLLGSAQSVDLARNVVIADIGEFPFDYLLLACGSTHSYFGHDAWEKYAPGLKTVEDATEIRRRVLIAFEEAERVSDPAEREKLLTFVVVGGGPTGVELAGAIGEMRRFTLARDFRSIDARSAKIVLIEAGPRILPAFSETQAARAVRDLERLGVHVWTGKSVTAIDEHGVQMGTERLPAATILWAAGVQASPLGRATNLETDPQGRVVTLPDLSVKGYPNVFVAGDQARFTHQTGKPLPGTAPVAMQQGRYIGHLILGELHGQPRRPFKFVDKGQMATIGRSRAIVEIGPLRFSGWFAWIVWLVVHIYYLTGFKNRLLVVLQWAWSYITFGRGARLIVGR